MVQPMPCAGRSGVHDSGPVECVCRGGCWGATRGKSGQLDLAGVWERVPAGLTAGLRAVDTGAEIAAQKVKWVDSTTALVSFDLRGVALGLYDVVVTQGGESRSLAGPSRFRKGEAVC
jgi:hypothetical protein